MNNLRSGLVAIAAVLSGLGPVHAADGPFGKFDDHKPEFEGRSARSMYDIERCMLDIGGKYGPPTVYSQPDRPEIVTMLWTDKSTAMRRIDLRIDGSGTLVRAWHPRDQAADCAGLGQP